MHTALAILAAFLVQVSSSPVAETGSIEGVVLGPNGAPIPSARVQAMWVPSPLLVDPSKIPTATTGEDGSFRFDGLTPSGYRLYISAPGYVYQGYGARPGRQHWEFAMVLNVAAGENKGSVVVNLSRGGLVSGRVLSTNGTPMVRMRVEILSRTFDDYGWASLTFESAAETNDRGEYRIDGIAPGRYYVRASPIPRSVVENEIRRAALSGEGLPMPVLPTPGSFVPTFYPASSDYSKGLLIEVTSGDQLGNIDIALPKLQTYRIRGRVINPAGGPLPRQAPSLAPTPATTGPDSFTYLPDGTFQWNDVAPGVYWLTATSPQPLTPELQRLLATPGANLAQLQPMGLHGTARLRVIDSDIENVELKILPSPSLQGRVRLENVTAALSEVKIQVHSVESSGQTGSPLPVAVNDEGNFSVNLRRAWEYRVSLSGIPPDLYVKEARLGKIDALVQTLELIETPTDPLEILLARGGVVEGTVRDGSSRPVADQLVVLVPAVQGRASLYRTVETDSSGRFQIQGIAPGEYRVFAWRNLERFRYFDPDFVGEFEEWGVQVKVAASERTRVDVTQIP